MNRWMETFHNQLVIFSSNINHFSKTSSNLSSCLTSSGELPETMKTSFISSCSKLHEYPMFSAVSVAQIINISNHKYEMQYKYKAKSKYYTVKSYIYEFFMFSIRNFIYRKVQ